MRLKATGLRITTGLWPGLGRRPRKSRTAIATAASAATTSQSLRAGTPSRDPRRSGSVGPNSSRTTDTADKGSRAAGGPASRRGGEADDLQPALERLQRERARLVDRRAEHRLVVGHVLRDPLRLEHALGHRPDLHERALDRLAVAG